MRIHEIILEDGQLDEITALGSGQRVGRFGGNVVRGTKDFFTGIKQGYRQARSGQPAPTQGQQGSASAQGASGTGSSQGQAGTTPAQSTSAQGQSGTTPTQGAAPGQGQATPAQPTAMKAAEIVKDLDDVWSKATADQGSETTSFPVQNQIKAMAKQAGLAGQTIKERKVGFQSNFLNMTI